MGPQQSCSKPDFRVHPVESTGTWIFWALLWLMGTSVACSLHRSRNAYQGLEFEMLQQVTWHAKQLLLSSTGLNQHVVQNTICQLAKMGPMG